MAMSINNHTQYVHSININGQDLSALIESLKARQNSITHALSSATDDYDTELIDARADTFGNNKDCIGDNIRDNQIYLYNLIMEKFNILETAYNQLSFSVITLASIINNLKGD